RARSNPDRQRQNAHYREARIPPQLPRRKTQVGEKCPHRVLPPKGPHFFPGRRRRAQLQLCRPPRLFLRETALAIRSNCLVEVKPHLVVDLAVALAAME